MPRSILLSFPEFTLVRSIQHDDGVLSFSADSIIGVSVVEGAAVVIAVKGVLPGTAFSGSEVDCVGVML